MVSESPLTDPMGDFGSKFRQAREKKNLSLDDVSNVTKISARMLKAIEEEHFDQLPGGVFNRGFVRAYAKHLGLNDEEAVTDYLACLREAQIDAHEVWDPVRPELTRAVAGDKPRVAGDKPRVAESRKPPVKAQPPVKVEELPELQLPRVEDIRPPRSNFGSKRESGIPWSIITVAAVVVFLAIFLWTRHSRSTRAATSSAAAPLTSNSVPAATPATLVAGSTTPAPPTPQATTPSPEKQAAKPAPKSAESAPSNTSAPAASQTPAATTKETSDVTIRSFAPSSAKPTEKPALTLVIRATETSWISVQADGQLVSQETLIAPAATSFHANRQLVVRVGNAAGVRFLWKGEELPPQGAESEAKTFVFDASGMQAPPSDQIPH